MTVAPTPLDGPQSPSRRWRFSIRQLLVVVAVIAVALFVYREVPEMIRRQVYNDPVPLVVGDSSKLHVRQILYLPTNQFAYRLHLPPDQPYEVCIGFAGPTESIPEPARVKLVNEYPAHMTMQFFGCNDWYITGHVNVSETDREKSRILVQVERPQQTGNPLTFEFEPVRNAGSYTTYRPLGLKNTESFAPDQELIVYRTCTPLKSDGWEHTDDPYTRGRGLVVWIRPASAKKTK